MRDDFSEKVKRTLGERVNSLCSNPECRAQTRGPQLASDKSINIGVAAHITAASKGGPRYNPRYTAEYRSRAQNGIYLCSSCAKMIDCDPTKYTVSLLCQWKKEAEAKADYSIGRTRAVTSEFVASQGENIQRNLNLRNLMHEDFYHPIDERFKYGRFSKPYNKFRYSEVIIHSTEDKNYPNIDEGPGISGWFKLEVYDFYHNGLMFILWIHRGIIDKGGNWKIINYRDTFDERRFKEIKVWQLGRIPWRNIITYDMKGDEYYPFPHIYCKFADKGMPYEDFEYMIFGEKFDWTLEQKHQVSEKE